jgi:diguanylate cyclase (GGDEF)-like protein
VAPGVTAGARVGEAAVEAMVSGSAFAVLLVDPGSGAIEAANPAADLLFGHGAGELVRGSIRTFLPSWDEDTRAGARAEPAAVHGTDAPSSWCFTTRGQRLGGRGFAAEVHVRRRDGDRGWVLSVRSLDGAGPAPQSQLQELVSLLNATLESTADGILVVGLDGSIVGINARFASLWGIPATVLATHDDAAVMALVLGQLADPDAFACKVRELYARPEAESLDVLEFLDGRVFERFSRPQMVADRVVGRVWSFRDITSQRRAEAEADLALRRLRPRAEEQRKLAYTDPLTGLGNRALFNEVLETRQRSETGRNSTVLLLDLDDFKEVNDLHGHQAGDRMLVETARRLRACVGKRDTIARIGGDEFVIVLDAGADADAVAQRVVDELRRPVEIGGVVLRPSLSLGVATRDADGCPENGASDLFRRADIAMYEAKKAGKNRYVRFHPDMMAALVARTGLQESLREAVAVRAIRPAYQPVRDRAGAVVQFEALARWHRDGAWCPPSVFIPEAESSGLIHGLGDQILGRACVEAALWLDGDPRRSLAVNVSGVQIRRSGFARRCLETVVGAGVDPRQLVLEVTESLFLGSDDAVVARLAALRQRGVRIALDDFGTGYSSFGRLQELPVDMVKLDKSFIDPVRTEADRSPVVESMIDMAHKLGLTVTAEGVETRIQADYLMGLGCDRMQGFLFGDTLPFPASG